MTRVVNMRREKYDVYIGRPTIWGNPFVIGPDGDRDAVIAKYEAHVRASPLLMGALTELDGKVLGCYCKPKACHGDVLVRLIEELRHPDVLQCSKNLL